VNKYEHAANSVIIFGGKSEDYQNIHALIDSNKTVTPSIFGRFYLHHSDVGGIVTEKVFGKSFTNSNNKKVLVRDVLLQHLIEDYDMIPTFGNDWSDAFDVTKFPKLLEKGDFYERAFEDKRLKGLTVLDLKEIDNIFHLGQIAKDLSSSFNFTFTLAIFGHALGADLLAQTMKPKFKPGFWTSDVLTGYLNSRFDWGTEKRDLVPTLLDYEQAIIDKRWMHAPYEDGQHPDPKETKKKLDYFKQTSDRTLKSEAESRLSKRIEKVRQGKTRTHTTPLIFPRKEPCNYD